MKKLIFKYTMYSIAAFQIGQWLGMLIIFLIKQSNCDCN